MSNKYFISPFFPASFGTQPPENGFEIQRKTEDGEWELLAYIEDPDADFFEDDDVIEETTYTYRVRRFVSREPEEWSNETSVYVYYGRAAVSSVPSAFLHIGPAPVSIKTARASKIIPGALEIQVIPLLPRARTAIVSSVRPDSAVVQVAMQAPGIKTARKARADAPAAIIKAQFLPPQTMSQRGIKTTLPASIVLARALLPYIRSTANTVLQVPQAVIDISSLAPSAGVADAIHTTVDGPDIRPEVVAAVHLKNDPESLSKVSGENLTSANDGLRIAPSIRLFHGDNEIIDSDGKIPWSVLKGNPSITAGTGLTGGGALTDSRSLSIDFAAADASSGVGVSSQVARLDHHHDSRYLRISPTGSQTIFYPNANTSTILRMSSGAVASPFVIQDSSESPVFSVNTDGAITQGSIAWSRITSKPSIVNSISAGTGISVSGSGSVTISNSDRGSSQNIFKKIRDTSNNDQFAASSNDDYIQFGASGIASVSFSPSDKRVTYSASLSAGTNISVSGSQISTVNNPTFSTSVTTPLVTNAGALTIRTTGSNNLILSTDSSERMRITGAGDVGIGTTSPSHKLDISGTARVSGALTLGTQATGTEHAVRADRTITIAGTSNQINVSAGAQNLTANRTWTLSLPQDIHTGASPTFRRVISSTGYAFRDTRDVNDSPADKMNGNMSLDFKDRSAVGNPPASASAHGTYAHIVTLAGWPNQSGGRPTQLSTGASGIAVRQASSDSAWGPWWSAVMESPSGNVSWSGELTSGSVPAARVTGILDAARIPNLNASKITTGILPVARGGTGRESITSGRILFGAGTSAIGNSSNLFWNNSNNRLGIGTSSPSYTLDVAGDVGWTGEIKAGSVPAGRITGTIDAAILPPVARQGNHGNSYRFTVGGNANSYYPVRIPVNWAAYGYNLYSITRGYSWPAPDTWNTPTHRGGLTLTFYWSGDSSWGGNHKAIRVVEFHESYTTMVAGLDLATNGLIVWLRGGGAQYELQSPAGASASVQVHLNGHTDGRPTEFPVRTDTSQVNSEIGNKWPVRGVNVEASRITGTLSVAHGGTGIASYTSGNYIRASGSTTLEQRTPAQVRSDIGAAASSTTISAGAGLTGGGSLASNRTISVDSTVVRTTDNQTIAGTKTFSGTLRVTGTLRIPVT